MTYRKIPFQKLRLFFFGIRHARHAEAATTPKIANAHRKLMTLAAEAMKAINDGPESAQYFVDHYLNTETATVEF